MIFDKDFNVLKTIDLNDPSIMLNSMAITKDGVLFRTMDSINEDYIGFKLLKIRGTL